MYDNHIIMDISVGMVGTHTEEDEEAKYNVEEEENEEDEEEEESGWTSYLATESSNLSILLSESSAHSVTNNFIDDDYCRVAPCNKVTHHHNIYRNMLNDFQLVAKYGNVLGEGPCEEALREAPAFPDQESHSSSTLSDASSLGQSHRLSATSNTPIKRYCSRLSQNQQKIKRNIRQNERKLAHAANLVLQEHLEDTASSSPSLAQREAKNSSASSFSVANISERQRPESCACNLVNGDQGDVSKRFKALEALIPRLKEVAGKANEEEMLNVIISHVQDLELKVELLSNVWRLFRQKHQ
eukprot:c2873_g1_i1 orf=181-1077(+)